MRDAAFDSQIHRRLSRMSSNVLEHDSTNSQYSLAHELAVALMPEPSSGSRLLAEEFGIEYDEGAEGIEAEGIDMDTKEVELAIGSSNDSLAGEFDPAQTSDEFLESFDTTFSSRMSPSPTPDARDDAPMASLARSMESTDHFLDHLRNLDSDTHSAAHPTIERITSDMIRRINDTVRDREDQVRELLEAERELRKISTGLGGTEVLGGLDELDTITEIEVPETPIQHTSQRSRPLSDEWDVEPRVAVEDDLVDSIAMPSYIHGPLTPAQTISQLRAFRTFTASLTASLVAISEQTQVTGAATTEAGRKIRSLKNKLGGWRVELDNAELSRLRVERWEAGISDDGEVSPMPSTHRRMDGRKVVAQHLQLFELHIAEATTKTQAIMAM